MPTRGRSVSKGRPPSSAPIGSHIVVIGSCRLDVPDTLGYELTHEGFSTEIQDIGTLKVYEAVTRIIAPPVGLSYTLLNPKNVDGPAKLLLQDVLHLYNVELPAMSFAANTGKESPFLESCIMDGKYCTLILRKNEPGSTDNELVAAVTFQILPPDTRQAEIPLAAVRHAHQRKGYGSLIYRELQRRLVDVGVTSVYCWGDVESEVFWSKQGFVKVAEVDGRGKPKKLPIKGELKKAMSIPGNATLMTSHLDCGHFPTTVPAEDLKRSEVACYPQVEKTFPDSPSQLHNSKTVSEKINTSSPMNLVTTPQLAGEVKSSRASTPPGSMSKSPQLSSVGFQKCNSSITPLNMEGKIFSVVPSESYKTDSPETGGKTPQFVMNPLAIVPFLVPDSEPLDLSGNSGHGLPVTDVTNVLASSRTRGPMKGRTYVRRQQTKSSSTCVNMVPDSVSPTSSGKENTADATLSVKVGGAASGEEGKLSAFLGPRKKVSHRKSGAPMDLRNSSGQLDSTVKDGEVKFSSPSGFIGPRRKSGLMPECNPGVFPHGDQDQVYADEATMTKYQETGDGAQTPSKSAKRRPVKVSTHELQENNIPETLNNGDQLLPVTATETMAGVKRGIQPQGPMGKVQKDQEETVTDQVLLPELDVSEQMTGRARPIKRGKVSTSAGEGVCKQIQYAGSVSALDTASGEEDKAIQAVQKNSDETQVLPEGRPALSTSATAGAKTGLKRGRQAKVVGTRAKRGKADNASHGALGSNQITVEVNAEDGVHVPGRKEGEEGLAEIVNMLVPENKAGDLSAQKAVNVKKITAGPNSVNVPLQEDVHVSNNVSADSNQTIVEDRVSEPETTAGAQSAQLLGKPKYVIMFMNMADEKKKRQLITHVEKLGGLVTCEGSKCTHVVTMEVRRTLNFCVAVSSGAWILSPDWLKASVKHKTFIDEEPFVLRDKKFESKYNTSLRDVIPRARQMPNLLLDGLYIYPTPHVHPPVNTISEIMKSAGGQVLETLEEALRLEKKSLGIVVACEEDMEQAMAASKAGLRTYNSDWLLTCIVKQELDFSVSQFTESL